VLATALLCFSLLLSALPVVSAVSLNESEVEASTLLESNLTSSSLSLGQLAGLPGYITANEEPVDSKKTDYPIDYMPIDGGSATPAPVHTLIIVDDKAKSFLQNIYNDLCISAEATWSDTASWAYNILEGGDDPFWNCFGIDYVCNEYRAWVSPSGTLKQLLDWAQQTFPKPAGVEVTFVFTGQGEPLVGGYGERPGDAFIVSACAMNYLCPLVNVWQHEASHNYGVYDHSALDFTVCIMSGWYIAVTRSWCSGCYTTITQNRYHFG